MRPASLVLILRARSAIWIPFTIALATACVNPETGYGRSVTDNPILSSAILVGDKSFRQINSDQIEQVLGRRVIVQLDLTKARAVPDFFEAYLSGGRYVVGNRDQRKEGYWFVRDGKICTMLKEQSSSKCRFVYSDSHRREFVFESSQGIRQHYRLDP